MTSPFDGLAASYNALWSDAPRGRNQRVCVWREIDELFQTGDQVLDLGCGTGDDALYLAKSGIDVFGIDASPKMVEIARLRGVRAEQLAIEDLDRLSGPFSGALSNFGALNCVRALRPVAEQLARLIDGPVAVCLMGRLCWPEIAHGITRRLPGRAQWRGIEIYYPTAHQVRAAFEPYFNFNKRVSIGHGDHQLYIFRRRRAC